ncbi:MAG TPA: MBL fold metallo-hydrolase [Thermoanaerobaculaceae bacterium]|nr:MBL fold metallo-hydrolase [Thermoanaerobaculaceae bacterium]
MGRANEAALREIAPDVHCLGPRGFTQTNVFFVRSGRSWVLVDAGWEKDAAAIEHAATTLFGAETSPAAILLTHCHPDHSGSALPLARAWKAPVFMRAPEVPLATGDFEALRSGSGPLDVWIILPLLNLMGRKRRDAVLARSSLAGVARVLDADGSVPALPGWRWLATPGHTPGHASFFREADRVLISGDALLTLKVNSPLGLLLHRTGLSGPPWYTTWSARAAAESISALAALRPNVLAPGHGVVLAGPGTADACAAFARTS